MPVCQFQHQRSPLISLIRKLCMNLLYKIHATSLAGDAALRKHGVL
jgi:hypothetical protein